MENSLSAGIRSLPACIIRQVREFGELVGYESRNKYAIESEDGQALGFAAEQGKGLGGFFMRQALGHWRTFEIHLFDNERKPVLRAHHPFRFYFARINLHSMDGRLLGSMEQRFSILRKRFDVLNPEGQVIMEMNSPFFSIWTFPVFKQGREVAKIIKKWGGILKEAFLDADTFRLEFSAPSLTEDERTLLLVAAVFIDLRYFEKKAGE